MNLMFNLLNFLKDADVWIADVGMTVERLEQIDYSSVTDSSNWISLLGVEKTLSHQKFKIFTIFDMDIWLFLLISLMLLSVLDTKFRQDQNTFLTLIISLINHTEELISKSGKTLVIMTNKTI